MLSRALLALAFVGFLSTTAFAQDYPQGAPVIY